MVTSADANEIEVLSGQYREIFDVWFDDINKYEGDMDRKFQVWVKMEEISLSLWHNEVFTTMSKSWGRFILVDKVIEEKKIFDFAMILVEVESMKSIKASTSIILNGRMVEFKALIAGLECCDLER